MHVFLDLDGVIVDFVKGACDYHGVADPYLDPKNHGKYDIHNMFDIRNFYEPFNHDFWAVLHWTPDAKQILGRIVRYVDESQITILTKPMNSRGAVEGKATWLRHNMPRIKFLIGNDKASIAGPDKLLIDDYDKNIDDWNGPKILVPRPWNRLHKVATLEYLDDELRRHCKRSS